MRHQDFEQTLAGYSDKLRDETIDFLEVKQIYHHANLLYIGFCEVNKNVPYHSSLKVDRHLSKLHPVEDLLSIKELVSKRLQKMQKVAMSAGNR